MRMAGAEPATRSGSTTAPPEDHRDGAHDCQRGAAHAKPGGVGQKVGREPSEYGAAEPCVINHFTP